jgi:hypothetical protein
MQAMMVVIAGTSFYHGLSVSDQLMGLLWQFDA